VTDDSIAGQMQALEESLLHEDYAGRREALEQLLAADFREISPAGEPVTRDEVIQWICHKDPTTRWCLNEFRVDILADAARMLTYHAVRTGQRSTTSKGARHCSLWRFNPVLQCWQLAFHQSTRVA
jgi:hypothetical protein